MQTACPIEHRAGSVLVAYANFGVAAGAALRLMDSAVVVVARASWALTALAGPAPCDVLVLCPYLDATERRALLRAAAARDTPPVALELADVVGMPSIVRPVDSRAPGAPGREPLVTSVLRALAAPTS